MNLKSLMTGAAIAATVVGGSVAVMAPAQAAILTSGAFEIRNNTGATTATNSAGTTFDLDFAPLPVTFDDAGFSGLMGPATVQSLTLNKTGSTMFGPIANFFTGLTLAGDAVTFDVTSGELFANFTSATRYTVTGDLLGNLISGNSILGVATLNVNRSSVSNQANFFVTGETAVPTPALLPALLGMGAAALRKRKSEGSEAEETVGVKA
jgi:hypothetical protein